MAYVLDIVSDRTQLLFDYSLESERYHVMIPHKFIAMVQNGSAVVDVVPVFIENALDLHINDEDLIIKSPSMLEEEQSDNGPSICIEHVPTGIIVRSSGA